MPVSRRSCEGAPARHGARGRNAGRESTREIAAKAGAAGPCPIRDLRVEFALRRGVLTAIDGVSFDIGRGEVLGVVGESGAGKSVTGAAIIGLVDPPGRIAGGEIRLGGDRIDGLSEEEMRAVRGRRVGMIFQDP